MNQKNFFESNRKTVTDTTQKIPEKTKFNTDTNEEMDKSNFHVKALQLMNKN